MKKLIYILVLCSLFFLGCKVKENPQKINNIPNILFIYLDDLGYGDISCYNSDSRIQTPNIDKLAKEGISFMNAHSPAGICGPSRYGLLTGRYPWRTNGGMNNGEAFRNMWIEKGRTTLASFLKKNGYNTFQSGKWGLRHNYADALKEGVLINENISKDSFDFPKKRLLGANLCGFDQCFSFVHLSVDKNEKYAFENGLPVDTALDYYDPHRWLPESAMKVVDYIQTYAGIQDNKKLGLDRSNPFFIYWDPPSPHKPIVPNKNFVGKSGAGDYGDFVVEIDHYVGEIINTLGKNGLLSSTLIIFSSDNGPENICYERIKDYNHYSMGPLRGVKRDNWEGGHRVPLIVRWPGIVKENTQSDQLVCLTDWLATFADMVGQKLSPDTGEDSKSIMPILHGQKTGQPVRESVIYHTYRGQFAIRYKNWVYIDYKTGDANNEPEWFREERGVTAHDLPAELYDLDSDPQQTFNLFDKYPGKAKDLKIMLDQCRNLDGTGN